MQHASRYQIDYSIYSYINTHIHYRLCTHNQRMIIILNMYFNLNGLKISDIDVDDDVREVNLDCTVHFK